MIVSESDQIVSWDSWEPHFFCCCNRPSFTLTGKFHSLQISDGKKNLNEDTSKQSDAADIDRILLGCSRLRSASSSRLLCSLHSTFIPRTPCCLSISSLATEENLSIHPMEVRIGPQHCLTNKFLSIAVYATGQKKVLVMCCKILKTLGSAMQHKLFYFSFCVLLISRLLFHSLAVSLIHGLKLLYVLKGSRSESKAAAGCEDGSIRAFSCNFRFHCFICGPV